MTLGVVREVGQPALCWAAGLRFYFDGERVFIADTMVSPETGRAPAWVPHDVPYDGWQHLAPCQCRFCSSAVDGR